MTKLSVPKVSYALAVCLGLAAGGCAFDVPADVEWDAGPPDSALRFHVGGTVSNMWSGAAIEMELEGTGIDERKTVDANGTFGFDTELSPGTLYSITVATQPAQHECTVSGGTGTVAGEDVVDIGVDCDGPAVDMAISAPTTWTFDADTLAYQLSTSIALQAVQFTVTAPAATSIDLNAVPLTSGLASSAVALTVGDNLERITIHVDELSRVYDVTILRGTSVLEQYLFGKASNAAANDAFGAAVSLAGDTLIVGAPFESSAAVGVNGDESNNDAAASGAAYVFHRSGGTWVQEAYLKASNTAADDHFGSAVAIYRDLIVVGAPGEDSDACGLGGLQSNDNRPDSGAAYVFRRVGGLWSQEAYVKASNCGGADSFGHQVAVSGETFAISAANEDSSSIGVNSISNESASFAGAVYVFHRSGGAWTQEGYIKATNTNSLDFFGYSLSLDADTLVVGAIGESSVATGVGGSQVDNTSSMSGAVYVYKRNLTNWSPEAYVKATNSDNDDWFGCSVSVSGNSLVVGALQEDSNAVLVDGNQANETALSSGAAYLYTRVGTTWSPSGYFKASNTEAVDGFGASVAVTGDLIAVGATEESSNATGVNGDGADNSVSASGAVYVYRWNGTSWLHELYVKPTTPDSGDHFGKHLTLSTDTLVVSTEHESSSAIGLNGDQANDDAYSSGAAYVFR